MDKKKFYRNEYGELRIGRIVITSILLLAILMVVFSFWTIIPAGHTGVVSTFGRVSENVLQEGFHPKAPWQQVTKMDNRIVKLEITTEAFSSDLQSVSVCIAVNYRIDTSKSYSIIKNVGRDYENVLIAPTVNEVMKSIMSQHTAEQSITSRTVVSEDLMEGLNKKLSASGITVVDINIIDFDFSDAYMDAVEAKQIAEQKKLQATIEQEQKTIEKKAEAERQLIAAQTEAESIVAVAKAQAEANENLSKSLTSELIDYQKVEKWNGEMPTVYGGSAIVSLDDKDSTTPSTPAE